jgi:hypothetical protein
MAAPGFVEVPIGPHRADILGNGDRVIELQHSPIGLSDIAAREAHYGEMVWLFDATRRFEGIRSGDRFFFSFGQTRHIDACRKPVVLDFGEFLVQVESLTKVLHKFSGFGRVRHRKWFIDEYLGPRRRPGAIALPAKSRSVRNRWPGKQPWRLTDWPSRWMRSGQVRLLPKKTICIPAGYDWALPSGERHPVWSEIIAEHAQIANGWTNAELTKMRDLLHGIPMILDGELRVMPSPSHLIDVKQSAAAVRSLLSAADSHAVAGRIPALKDETRAALIQRAEQFEIDRFGAKLAMPKKPQERTLFD